MLSAFPVTLTFIAFCSIAMMLLISWIGLYRGKVEILHGDGGDPILFKRMRMHGNFTEVAPLTALTFASAEGLGLGAFWLWAGFVSFIAGRLLHYYLYDPKVRGASMFLTTAPAFAFSLWVLWKLWF